MWVDLSGVDLKLMSLITSSFANRAHTMARTDTYQIEDSFQKFAVSVCVFAGYARERCLNRKLMIPVDTTHNFCIRFGERLTFDFANILPLQISIMLSELCEKHMMNLKHCPFN